MQLKARQVGWEQPCMALDLCRLPGAREGVSIVYPTAYPKALTIIGSPLTERVILRRHGEIDRNSNDCYPKSKLRGGLLEAQVTPSRSVYSLLFESLILNPSSSSL